MRAIDKLTEMTRKLREHSFESPEKEAEILMSRGLGVGSAHLYALNPEIHEGRLRHLEAMLVRRLRHEPIQYILGYEEFMGLKIIVGPGVLVPRPETELMTEEAIETVAGCRSRRSPGVPLSILDLCTGSGCIALALAHAFPGARVFATDISAHTLSHARKSAEINGIDNVTFLLGSLFEPFSEISGGLASPAFDLIISNPPYVSSDEIGELQPEVRDWEPLSALDGGTDGIDFYRAIIPGARGFLKDRGILMLEVGAGQAGSVTEIMNDSGLRRIETIRDYAGFKRVIRAEWKR